MSGCGNGSENIDATANGTGVNSVEGTSATSNGLKNSSQEPTAKIEVNQ
ncbi:hypothetical protein [Paenibacillus turpanensis]|nr:hypothetical protein [Paenibacillus turpanensis]